MKATDLQIGNYVKVGNDIYQIRCIYDNREIILSNKKLSTRAIVKQLDGVPITTDILEKNGFKKKQFIGRTHYYCNYNESHIKALNFYGDDDVYVNEIEPHIPNAPFIRCAKFKYVHELQNALRLCKIEKEIVL